MCAHREQGGVVGSVCYKQAVEGTFCHLLGESLGPWSVPPPWPFPAGSWRVSASLHPMTPGSGGLLLGGLRVCVWLLPVARRGGPCKGPFTPQGKTNPSANPRGGRWGLGKWAGREECPVPAEMVWEGWDPGPPPSPIAGLSSREQCFAGWTETHLEG